ncbi:calretinin-like [Stylophora pistillata]|uniref:Calretinin n=1 Tax=Stylophora pistillata TaxID=50429 RepID=A0A2B4S7B9_STYPI|nr:calretinin-like [Stylophora pistillata]PFX24943.1 Calretinin [Stylophora pistillata]
MASSQSTKPFVTKFHGKTQLTSTEFMEVFRKFDKDGNGYIEARELDPFLLELFEARYHGLAKDKVKEMRELILERYDKNYDGRLEIDELAQILPTEQNFLLQFHRESKISSVEFMKIWNHYDAYREGYLEKKHLRGFFKDLLTVNNPHVSPQRIEELVNGALDSFDKNQDGEIELSEMAKLLPVEENFLSKFQIRENLSRSEFEKIWYHYDQDHNGSIGGAELDALIRDLYIKNNKEPPDMKTISDQRDMIMRFADRDGDDSIQKEELGMFFSVAQSRRVQEIKVDVEVREAERKAEKDAEKQEQAKKPDDGGSTDGSTGCCWLL